MSTRPRTRLSVDERRDQLLELGLELFSERPYDSVSINEIATTAGVSRGLLYHYFPSKRDFYVAVVRAAVDELQSLIEPAPDLDAATQLDRGLRRYIDFVARRRHGYLMATHGGVGADPEVAELVDGFRQTAIELVAAGLGPTELDARTRIALRGWVGYVEGMVVAWLREGSTLDTDELVELARRSLEATVEALGLPTAELT